jgi:ABC-type transport system involved in multi-copper enzyme maturation permease subunit
MPARFEGAAALRSIVRREGLTTLHNRYLQVFALLLVGGSLSVAGLAGRPASVPFGLLLLLLYVVPLFAVLVGVSSAHEAMEERPVLLSHPVPRGQLVAGKLGTLAVAMVGVLAVALLPAAWMVGRPGPLLVLWGLGTALVAIWASTGLALGVATGTRARGLVAGLCVWFASLVLYDLCALALSGVEAVQGVPALWVAVLMLNPADAVRLAGMTALEGVSFAAAGSDPAVRALLAWAPAWAAALAVLWTGAAALVAWRRLERTAL